MQTKLANDSSPERYVVEIDGITKSEYRVFVKALTASLQLKQEFPNSNVKLRDADEKARHCHDAVTSTASPPSIKLTSSSAALHESGGAACRAHHDWTRIGGHSLCY